MLIKYPYADCRFLENNAHIVSDGIGNEWYHLPHWYKKIGEGVFEIVPFEKLPSEMIKNLIENRE
jgi:hypothetical protein